MAILNTLQNLLDNSHEKWLQIAYQFEYIFTCNVTCGELLSRPKSSSRKKSNLKTRHSLVLKNGGQTKAGGGILQ
jgi:hypothetical protein